MPLAVMLALGLFCTACKPAAQANVNASANADADAEKAAAGVYTLVTVDGKPMPADISHEGHALQVRSGSFTLNADGTCSSKMVFVPAGGLEVTREVSAAYTRTGSKLDMRWKGAGTTTGTLEGTKFTMNNEGMTLIYQE
jgi:hypothetical protein